MVFAASTFDTATASLLMTKAIVLLKAKVFEFRSKVVLYFWIPSSTRDAASSAISTIEAIIRRLDGPSRAAVLSGTLPISKWLASAEEASRGIVDQYRLMDDGSFADLVGAQMDQALDELAVFASKAGEGVRGVGENLSWLIPLVGLGIVGIYLAPMFLPRLLKR